MKLKAVSGIMLMLLLIGMLILTFNIQPVKASGTIYIRPDGSIEPSTAPIHREGDLYTLTDNINDSLVIQRNNTVVDGAGYTLQGTGASGSKGIDISGRSNVTIKNMEIKAFHYGIWLCTSSSNSISGNNITENSRGVLLIYSSSNILRDNSMDNNTYNFGVLGSILSDFVNDVDTSNTVNGKLVCYWINMKDVIVPLNAGYVALVNCTRITVKNLELINNMQGVQLACTTNSTIAENNIKNNNIGVKFYSSSNNNILGNNITNIGNAGISISYSSNSTLTGNNITNCQYGINLDGCMHDTIERNNITNNNHFGIVSWVSNYTNISGNIITENNDDGIYTESVFHDSISENTIANSYHGISLGRSSNNTVSVNTIANNEYGIYLAESSNNTIYHNNFVDNTIQAYVASTNVWDDGYPSGGNYWSNHVCVGNPSDGSQPYIIDQDNIDRYPFQNPNGWLLPPPPPVGGKATPINIPMNKPETPTLWIWLTTIILSLAFTVVYVKKRNRHTEINS